MAQFQLASLQRDNERYMEKIRRFEDEVKKMIIQKTHLFLKDLVIVFSLYIRNLPELFNHVLF